MSFSDFFESDTELVDTSQPYVLPKAERTYSDPAVEYGARQLLGSYFGGEGQPGLISQQIPVPIRQTAGLSPLEIQARNTAGGLGGFAPQLNQAQQYYQQSAMGYNPMMAQSFMNPYMSSVYAPQMQEIQRLGEAQKRDARAQQVQAGAFGGSRGAVQEAEIDRSVLDKQAQFGSDLAYKGYGDAMERSMTGFENMQGRRAGTARGIAGLGQQGYNMLTGQIDTLAGLGQTGRGIQDTALGSQYKAATQMADEPYMRLQRGQQMLGGLGGLLPQYMSGFGSGQGTMQAYQDPSMAAKLGAAYLTLSSLGQGQG
jgi:hypothetical protein